MSEAGRSPLTGLLGDQRGTVMVMVAIGMVALLGIAGLAIDASHLYVVRTKLQGAADAAALAASAELPQQATAMSRALSYAGKNMSAESSGVILVQGDVSIGHWEVSSRVFSEAEEAPPNAVRVVTRRAVSNGNPAPTFFMRVFGYRTADVIAEAIAIAIPQLIYKEPHLTQLDPEAADYNRLSVYCFDAEAKDSGGSDGRSQMTVVADNGGTSYSFTMPRCEPGEVLSYKLENVRQARSDPDKWNDPNQQRYLYHSDTRIVDGVETYDLGGYDILETVLCDSLEVCTPVDQGGIIPTGKNRTPERATQSCVPGKLMYYGWEDRPPGLGWTDQDYDDIRVIIECPTPETEGKKIVRLVR